MRIDRLELKNYRGFTSLDLDFTGHRTTVLVGSNGCGKTSVLDGLAAMLKCLVSSFTRYGKGHPKHEHLPLFVPLDVNNKQEQLEVKVSLALNGPAFIFGAIYKRLGAGLIPNVPDLYTNEVNAVHRSGPYPVLVYYPVSRAVLDRYSTAF